jgi:hypothetical protein
MMVRSGAPACTSPFFIKAEKASRNSPLAAFTDRLYFQIIVTLLVIFLD